MRREALNKFNAPEVLAALKGALEKAGLDDTVQELKRRGFFKIVNDAWMNRGKTSAVRVASRWADSRVAGGSVTLKTPALVTDPKTGETTENVVSLHEVRRDVLVRGAPRVLRKSEPWFGTFQGGIGTRTRMKTKDRMIWENPQEVLAEARKHVQEMCQYFLR